MYDRSRLISIFVCIREIAGDPGTFFGKHARKLIYEGNKLVKVRSAVDFHENPYYLHV